MTQYTTNDFKELDVKINQKLNELESTDQTNRKSVLQICRELIELERIKLTNNQLPIQQKQHFASYIISKVKERVPTFQTSGSFFNCFEEDEKIARTNFEAKVSLDHTHKFENTNDDRIQLCSCGVAKINGIEYDVVTLKEESDEVIEQREKDIKEKADATKYPESHYFYLVQENGMLLSKLSRALWVKFFDRDNPKQKSDKAEIITKALGSKLTDKIEEQKEIKAELLYLLKISDERQKIGEFEKLKALLLMDGTFNPSHVANMLGITDKHATNIIKAKRKEILEDYKEGWFSNIHLPCHVSTCQNVNTYSIGEWIDHSLIRKDLGLTLKQPFTD